MDTGRVEVPNNLQGEVQRRLERLADQHPRYDLKSSAWLEQVLRRAGATRLEGIFEPDRREELRKYLRQGEAPIRYVMVPVVQATHYESDKSFTYAVTLERVDLEDDFATTVRGQSELTIK
ncbi:MAG: hypothetical protein KDB53_17670, partial [Planctomycetes bacterium]|nr:hypothetical protein [Planctomycetota bacterium]